MSHATAAHSHEGDHAGHGHAGHGPNPAALTHDNTHAPGFAKGLSLLCLLVGLVGCAGVVAYWFMGGEGSHQHAIASYHVGAIVALGLTLGSLGIVLIMHMVGAGWVITLRRQMENAAAMIPVAALLLLPSLVLAPTLWHWMSDDPQLKGDVILQGKVGYLNPMFFYIRIAFYFAVWGFLAVRLSKLSTLQDRTGDKWLSAKAKFMSFPGMLLFAMCTAFGSFDLIMSLDHHWFSTMFGVYFFAGNMVSGLALAAVVLGLLRSSGKLGGLVTAEHFHDLGKLMFGFTVFWAYIGFSQYFLYWYANIPEETAWFVLRTSNGWEILGTALILGRFIIPFLILIFRDVKRSSVLLPVMGVWIIAGQCLDVFWMIRPVVHGHGDAHAAGMGLSWVDVAGLVGPLGIWLGLLLRRVASLPLIPLKDPKLFEAMNHKNYV
ncbi:MAG: hypothetical protein ACKVS8_13665 [Phycisphaerales bacterium]